jgi:hypothetical protein
MWQSVVVYNEGFVNKKLFLTVRGIRKCPEFSAANLVNFQYCHTNHGKRCFSTVPKFTFFGFNYVNVEQTSATQNISLP